MLKKEMKIKIQGSKGKIIGFFLYYVLATIKGNFMILSTYLKDSH